MALDMPRSRNVTAVLGPTNTGKTHLAIERMVSHETGMIGLPLRLLAREIYDKLVARVGAASVALVTGEEKIKPDGARYWVSTVEAMPREIDVDFLAIDEVQLASDPERGHTFTDRLLFARGKLETLLLGAGTMRDAIAELVPGANFISRPRLSKLAYSGQKKITRLPGRSAVIAFSASDVYAIAELIRRQRGGAAVVLGALSPRTRNAQVALYQSGDVDYIVATDAVGMGLNLDVDHVAFSAVRKFDGENFRNLTASEIGQIAGRAGRHMNDGTFGVTGDVDPLDNDLIERLETHTFDPVRLLQWRNRALDFTSLEALRDSLRAAPPRPRLVKARSSDDVIALDTLSMEPDIAQRARSPQRVELLWETCQIPDYRKISSQNHAELIGKIYRDLTDGDGVIDEDWFARQVAYSDRTDGDIDTLANRIAHIRTWTFLSNRPDWLKDPNHWQERTRAIEDALSDALHVCLTNRFVDQRTSALIKGLRLKDELKAEIADDGQISVEDHFVGRLVGFRFKPDSRGEDAHGKATRHAAAQVLAKELSMRARRVAAAKNDAFVFAPDGHVLWRSEPIAELVAADDALKPQIRLLSDEHLQPLDRDKVQARLQTLVTDVIAERLKPLVDLINDDAVTGLARGIAFRLSENLGVLRRDAVAADIKALDQNARSQLRRHGVRFGAFNIFFPQLLKPAPADLLRTLWLLKHGPTAGLVGDARPEPPRAGLTSVAVDAKLPETYYAVSGFHICGPRAVRLDMLERLADQIRGLLAWRPQANGASQQPPRGSTGDGAFTVTPDMMSILGCSADELGSVLRALGFRSEQRPKPVTSVPTRETIAAAEGRAADAATTAADASVPEPQSGLETLELVATASEDGAQAGPQSETAPISDAEALPSVDGSLRPDAASPEPEPDAAPRAALADDGQSAGMGDSAGMVESTGQGERDSDADAVTMSDERPETASVEEDGGKPGAEEAVAAPPQEPELIEVWRPRRRNDGAEVQNRGRRGTPQRGRRDGPGADRPSEAQQRPESAARAEGGANTSGAPGNAGGHAGRHDRGRPNQQRPWKGRGSEQDRSSGQKQHAGPTPEPAAVGSGAQAPGRQHGQGKGRDRDERHRGGDRRDRGGPPKRGPSVISSKPAAANRVEDSPFAALAKLKQTLEQAKSDET